MKIAVTGASGLIGQALCADLSRDGHEVVRLVRRAPSGPAEVFWDPAAGDLDVHGLDGVETIYHLAGAGVGDHRWTDEYKALIRDSRVLGTSTITSAAAAMSTPPAVVVCASAIGYYGDRGDEILTEDSEKGTGFLSDVVADWEAAADPARHAGIRVVNARTGLVVSDKGGAWQRMIKLFKMGVGGRLGSGDQYWSFISIADEVRALRYLADSPNLEGPVNLTAPHPVTNAEATAALGKALRRPSFLPAPAFALRAALGEFSIEVLGSSRVIPKRLSETDFTFTAPTMQEALQQIL